MGISGFDVSGSASITQQQASATWSKVTGSSTHHLPASLKGVTNLNSENFTQNRTFVGASWNLLLLNLSAEYDRTGEISTYGLKAGLRF